ncbi:GSCOCG00001503001-RA-CDS [Cotesia congregata]|nr:GSCOCG00001503001-RA-CDS [Cotesia congregata]
MENAMLEKNRMLEMNKLSFSWTQRFVNTTALFFFQEEITMIF